MDRGVNPLRRPSSVRPPERRVTQPAAPRPPTPPLSIREREVPHGLRPLKKRHKRWPWIVVWTILIVLITGAVAAYLWYQNALEPFDETNDTTATVVVSEGESVSQVARALQGKSIIKSALAFQIYTELSGTGTGLQVGRYLLSPAQSTPEIVDILNEGATSEVPFTVIPGTTLQDIAVSLEELGYSEAEIDEAFMAPYEHSLLADRPEGASLEGYIYPETYLVEAAEPLESVLMRTFDTFYAALQEEKLLTAFKERDLSIHEAITLGSIIEREVQTPDDRQQVAQVFYKRLAEDMPLGADATFVYGAEILGVEPRVSLDSPYNTRQVKGIPPGPIGTVALSALEAVAHPAEGEFLYFVTGDDGVNRFSKTEEEHEENVQQYCQELCNIYNQ